MWRFNLSKPALNLQNNGYSYFSFRCHKQQIEYSTTSRLSSSALNKIMSGTASVEIHHTGNEHLKDLVQMQDAKYFSERKIGEICLWNSGEYESDWHTSCSCELDGTKFQWLNEVSKVMLQSSRELVLSMTVGFLGFRVPNAEPFVPTSSEFEKGAPYFFEEVAFNLFESE